MIIYMDYPINFTDQLAQHLKSFRKSRGLTQAQLALHLGVTQSRVADIETNPGKVSLENLLKVLSALNVRMILTEATSTPTTTAGSPTKTSSALSHKSMTLAERKALINRPTLKDEDW